MRNFAGNLRPNGGHDQNTIPAKAGISSRAGAIITSVKFRLSPEWHSGGVMKHLVLAIFATFILSACGGGGGGGGPSTDSSNMQNPPAVTLPPSDGVNYRTSEFLRNYGLAAIRADAAYQRGAFGQSVTVGVVDTGVRTRHRELDRAIVGGRDFVFPGTPITDADGHGTGVAAVIGGERDDISMHGVAPSVRIMPLKIGDSAGNLVGNSREALRWAIDRRVPIINASFGEGNQLFGNYGNQGSYSVRTPFFQGFINNSFRGLARELAGIVRNTDAVVVWGAGNAGWNSVNGVVRLHRCTGQPGSLFGPENCPEGNSPLAVSQSEFINGFDSQNWCSATSGASCRSEDVRSGYGMLATVAGSGDANVPSFNSLVPQYEGNLQNNWLAVVATDRNNQIADFSNGCGDASMWCLAAPGSAIFTADTSAGSVGYRSYNGTSFAAPHVSGALALLKSAAPELSMPVVRRILLTTAMDLGASGVDETYGWGLVNVSAGISHIARMRTANGVLLSDMRRGLPSEFDHLRGRLAAVSVALRITDDSYWNMPLTAVLGESRETKHSSGAEVKRLMAAGYEAGESFRFSGGADYDGGASRFIGEGDGIFGASDASDASGYVKWTTADYGGFSAFGEYGYTAIEAEYGGSSLVAGLDSARAEEWTAGLQFADMFRYGDLLRLSARQESRLSGGEMVLRYPVAEGDSHLAFIGETPQTIRMQESRIPIREDRTMVYGIGYGREEDGVGWNAAAEWNSRSGAAAFWAELELEF